MIEQSGDNKLISDSPSFKDLNKYALLRFYESITGNANVWIMFIDKTKKIGLWNKAAEKISGYSAKEVTGKNSIWKCLYPDPEYRKKITKNIRSIIEKNNTLDYFEATIITKDGHERIISWNTRSLYNENDSLSGYIAIGNDITEKVHAKEALAKSEEMFRGLSNAAFHGIIIIDSSGSLKYWNKAAENIFGYSHSEIYGKKIQTLFGLPSKYPKNKKLVKYFSETGLGASRGKTAQFSAIRKNGESIPVEITLSAMNIKGQWNAIGIVSDISKRLEDEKQNKFLSEIVKCSNDAIIGVNPDGTVISWNHAAENIFEYSANEILGKSLLLIVPKGREKEIERELENIKNDVITKNFETVRISKSGKKLDVSIYLSPIKHDNKIIGSSVITRDITKEKEMSGIMIGYISEAAMRLKNPVEFVKNNLKNIIEQIQSEEMGSEDVILQLKVQVKNNEQILQNLRELNQAIIGNFGEIPEEYVEYFSQ